LTAHALGSRARSCAIVTAHTEDDQGETLLMRLARGSGIDGLSGMPVRRPLTEDGGVAIVRPLLEVGKCRLVASLRAGGVDWVEDPSNECLDFERARVRAARAELAALGLTNDKLALSARRIARAREALDLALADLLGATVDVHDGVFAEIDRRALLAAAPELRVRALMRVLLAFGGDAKAPRLSQVESLSGALSAREGQDMVALTLGGCIISAGAKSIRIFRERDPRGLPQIALEPGSDAIWDGRFRISLASAKRLKAARVKAPVVVRELGVSAYATLRASLEKGRRPPSRAAVTLPSFWAGEELIAVPQLVAAELGPARVGSHGHGLCRAQFVGWERSGTGVWSEVCLPTQPKSG
jgi:tRNA(Ile)-lysidine synthase